MATLTTAELAALRQAIAVGEHPSWSKQTLNAALQGVEDVLEAQALGASTLVASVTLNNVRAQGVKDDLDAGQVSAGLVPIVEDWLADNPPNVTTRSIDDAAINVFIGANRPAFNGIVSVMPADQRLKVIRLVIERRVRAVL